MSTLAIAGHTVSIPAIADGGNRPPGYDGASQQPHLTDGYSLGVQDLGLLRITLWTSQSFSC